MSDNTIQQEMLVQHEEMKEIIDEWIIENLGEQLSEVQYNTVSGFLVNGWSLCINTTMQPALDLSLILLQSIAMVRTKFGADGKLTLAGPMMDGIEQLCHEIAGRPETWQLDDAVEMVEKVREIEERRADELQFGDVFTYLGAFTFYRVLEEPVPCAEMPDRVVFEVRNEGSKRKHTLKIRFKAEQICEVIEKSA